MKHVKRQAKRTFTPPVIGDPGPQRPEHVGRRLAVEEAVRLHSDTMSTREMITLALALGLDAKDVCGIESCSEHPPKLWVVIKEAFANSKYAPEYVNGLDIVWCKRCWQWFRMRQPLGLDDGVPDAS